MGQTAVLCEVRWPYTSNLAYVESDEDVGPCHEDVGACACVALYLAGTTTTHACVTHGRCD
jgi:hypothetical protein